MKHKWYNEIVAWASGAEIECKFLDEKWDLVGHFPPFDDDDYIFRIKPPQHYLYVYKDYGELCLLEGKIQNPAKEIKYIGKIKLEEE